MAHGSAGVTVSLSINQVCEVQVFIGVAASDRQGISSHRKHSLMVVLL